MVFTKISPDQVELDVLRLALRCAHEAGLTDNYLVTHHSLSARKLRLIRNGVSVKARLVYLAKLADAIECKRQRLVMSGRSGEAQALKDKLYDILLLFMARHRDLK